MGIHLAAIYIFTTRCHYIQHSGPLTSLVKSVSTVARTKMFQSFVGWVIKRCDWTTAFPTPFSAKGRGKGKMGGRLR